MNNRYSTKPRRLGDLGFEWKEPLPDQEILFTELKDHIVKIEVDLKQLKGLLSGEKDEDWSTVTISYKYPNPKPTSLGGDFSEAEEQIFGPQVKVFNHVTTYYSQAIELFMQSWDRAKHDTLRNNANKLK